MATKYLATTNVPGYLPTQDDPPTFDTAREAWAYLADERARDEDDFPDDEPLGEYTDVVSGLRYLASDEHQPGNPHEDWPTAPDGTGSILGDTPGYDGTHDLGIAYSVTAVTEDDDTPRARLEYLRGEIDAERISYGEIAELRSLAEHIADDDTVLREWAGIPEHKGDGDGREATSDELATGECWTCDRGFTTSAPFATHVRAEHGREPYSVALTLPDGTAHLGRLQLDDDGRPRVELSRCGTCGYVWNDALITGITPTPSGRCPAEYEHEHIGGTGATIPTVHTWADSFGVWHARAYASSAAVAETLARLAIRFELQERAPRDAAVSFDVAAVSPAHEFARLSDGRAPYEFAERTDDAWRES